MKRCCQCCQGSIGAISPVPATKAMTQPVGQRDGQLYTTPNRHILIKMDNVDGAYVWSTDGISDLDYLVSQIRAGRSIVELFSINDRYYAASSWFYNLEADIPYVSITGGGSTYRLYDGGVTVT